MKLLTTAFCLFSSALFAREVNTAFLWEASEVDTGRVITGSTDETSGYWYAFDDGSDGETSTWIWPSDIVEDINGDFFGPLIRAYGGILGDFSLGEQCVSDGQTCRRSVGIGFNIWDMNQQGVDISAWKGFCLEYSASSDFDIRLHESEYNTNTLDLAASVAASDSLTIVDVPWEKFSWYSTGYNPFETVEEKLKNIAAVWLVFSGDSGETGSVKLTKIGSLGTCDGSFTAVQPFRAISPQRIRQTAPRTFSLEGFPEGMPYKLFDLKGNLLQKSDWNGGEIVVNRLPAILQIRGKAYLLR